MVPEAGQTGSFVDNQWLNGDPVFIVYRVPGESFIATAKPQSIYNFALGANKIAIAGEEPHLYGYRFVDRADMFPTREAAEDECARRNASIAG